MRIDMWYGNKFKRGLYAADAFFTPYNGYSGNIYDETGKPIGDYHTEDSTEIEAYFQCKIRD